MCTQVKTTLYGLVVALFLLVSSTTYAVVDQPPTVFTIPTGSSITTVLGTIGVQKAILSIHIQIPITGTVVIPSNVIIQTASDATYSAEGSFNIAAGASITFSGYIQAGITQIFFGLGNAYFSNPQMEVIPQWWGATGNGYDDDTLAIQQAINSASNVRIPDGTYVMGKIHQTKDYLGNWLLLLHSDLYLHGSGVGAILKLKNHVLDGLDDSTSNANIMTGVNILRTKITKISFDLNGANNLTPPGKIRNAMAILIDGGERVSVDGCTFLNSAGRNVVKFTMSPTLGNSARISNSTFHNGGRYVGGSVDNVNNTDFSFTYVEWPNSVIEHNTFLQDNPDIALRGFTGGVEIHGSGISVNNNIFVGTDPAMYVATSPGAVSNVTITKNRISSSLRGIAFFLVNAPPTDIYIADNIFELYQPAVRLNYRCTGIDMPYGSITNLAQALTVPVQNLTLIRNVFIGSALNSNKTLCEGINLYNVRNVNVSNNLIQNLGGSGISLYGGPWVNDTVLIAENRLVDVGKNTPIASQSAINISLAIPPPPTTAMSTTSNVLLLRNSINNTTPTSGASRGIVLPKIDRASVSRLNILSTRFLNIATDVTNESGTRIQGLWNYNQGAYLQR